VRLHVRTRIHAVDEDLDDHPASPREESPHGRREARHEEVNMQAYTVEQVAEMLHVGRDKIYCLLRTNQLRSIKIGKLRRITDQHLAEFLTSLEDAD